jgi:hypothetical protein
MLIFFKKALFLVLLTKTTLVLSNTTCQNVGNLQVFYDPACAQGK